MHSGVSSMSDDATIYRVSDATTWREVDGEVVALAMDTSMYHSIGGVGTRLWPLLVVGASHRRLVDELLASFPEESPVDISADVTEFVTRCIDLDLVEEASLP